MPHLAPLSWLPIAVLFWATLISILSFTWWSHSPLFPASSIHSPKPSPRHWNWN